MELEIKIVLLEIEKNIKILESIKEKTKGIPILYNSVYQMSNALLEVPRYYLDNHLLSELEYCWLSNKFALAIDSTNDIINICV